jgi:hypothetical protein
MGNKSGNIKIIPKSEISAATCNYARPNNAKACVKRLKELGLTEIIVWNNKAKPIKNATKNHVSSINVGSIGRYYIGLHTQKPYILIVDDDHMLTRAGLTALRKWAAKYPAVVQCGAVFNPPFKRYFDRKVIKSHQVTAPREVDLVLPYGGLLISTELCRRILDHWAWKFKEAVRPGFIATDLAVSCAILDLTGQHAIVAPSNGIGMEKLKDEAPHKALSRQKGARTEKTKILRWMINHGWKPLKMKKNYKNRG